MRHTLALALATAGRFEAAASQMVRVIAGLVIHEKGDLLPVYQDHLAHFKRHQPWLAGSTAGQGEIAVLRAQPEAKRPPTKKDVPGKWKAAV